MSVSSFSREDKQPTVIVFENSLKVNEFRLWRKFLNTVNAVYPNVTNEWEFLSRKFGWFLTYKSDGTVLFYVVPERDRFSINFVFDEATFDASSSWNLPQDVRLRIQQSNETDRGRSFYWPVRSTKDVELVTLLTEFQYEAMLHEAKIKSKKA